MNLQYVEKLQHIDNTLITEYFGLILLFCSFYCLVCDKCHRMQDRDAYPVMA